MPAIGARLKDLLDETRLAMLGTQLLIGLKYNAAFSQRFGNLPRPFRWLDGVALLLILATAALLLAVPAYHQIAEEGRATARMLDRASGRSSYTCFHSPRARRDVRRGSGACDSPRDSLDVGTAALGLVEGWPKPWSRSPRSWACSRIASAGQAGDDRLWLQRMVRACLEHHRNTSGPNDGRRPLRCRFCRNSSYRSSRTAAPRPSRRPSPFVGRGNARDDACGAVCLDASELHVLR
jgi:Family of unknown function (DUF6328)